MNQLHFFKVFNKHYYEIILAETEEGAMMEYRQKHDDPNEFKEPESSRPVHHLFLE